MVKANVLHASFAFNLFCRASSCTEEPVRSSYFNHTVWEVVSTCDAGKLSFRSRVKTAIRNKRMNYAMTTKSVHG